MKPRAIQFPKCFDQFETVNGIQQIEWNTPIPDGLRFGALAPFGVSADTVKETVEIIVEYLQTPIKVDPLIIPNHTQRRLLREEVGNTYGPEARATIENNALRNNRICGVVGHVETLAFDLQQNYLYPNLWAGVSQTVEEIIRCGDAESLRGLPTEDRVERITLLKQHLHNFLLCLTYEEPVELAQLRYAFRERMYPQILESWKLLRASLSSTHDQPPR